MHRYTRLLLTSLIAATALAAAVSSASANRLSVSNRNIRVTWSSLELSNSFNGNVVRCPVTLEGSFTEATIRKVLGALIGVISKATAANASCTNGHATVHQETLPWRITYQGFVGRLPRITVIRLLLIRASFEIETGGLTCSATTEELHPAEGEAILNEETGEVNGLRAQPERRIPLTGGFCGLIEGGFAGTGSVTLLGNTNKIIIKLI